jgi:hypothetical protein
MELETLNKLYLELSQIATAKTKRELELENVLIYFYQNIDFLMENFTVLVETGQNNLENRLKELSNKAYDALYLPPF